MHLLFSTSPGLAALPRSDGFFSRAVCLVRGTLSRNAFHGSSIEFLLEIPVPIAEPEPDKLSPTTEFLLEIPVSIVVPGCENLLRATGFLMKIHIPNADPGPGNFLRTTGVLNDETKQTHCRGCASVLNAAGAFSDPT